MGAFRTFFARHRALVALTLTLALLAKMLIPGGYMPMVEHNAIRIMVCPGTQDASLTATMPGMTHHDGKHGHTAGHDMPCGFSGLTLTATSAADPVVLALAVAFAMMLAAWRIAPILVQRSSSLRPPPRGPPIPV